MTRDDLTASSVTFEVRGRDEAAVLDAAHEVAAAFFGRSCYAIRTIHARPEVVTYDSIIPVTWTADVVAVGA